MSESAKQLKTIMEYQCKYAKEMVEEIENTIIQIPKSQKSDLAILLIKQLYKSIDNLDNLIYELPIHNEQIGH